MAKKFIFLTNIGNSDIEELKGEKKKFFETTKRILEENKWENLTLGILEPEIEELEKRYEDFSFSKIFLFGTKQEPSYSQDTIYAAEIAKRKIISRFNLNKEEIEIIPIKKNPADFDKMQVFYKDFLEGLKEILNENTDLIISITGGTPAQNFSLLLNSIFLFPEKVKAVYLFRGQKKPKFLNINQEIFNEIVKKQIQILKENELFYPSIKLIEKWPFSFTYDEKIKLEFSSAISQFNFQKAKEILENYPRLFSDTEKEKLERYLKFPQIIKERRLTQEYFEIYLDLILEVWKEAKRKWNQGEYTDFLGRIFRIEEGILHYLFEYETRVITQPLDSNSYPEFEKWAENEEFVKSWCEKEKVEKLTTPSKKFLKEYLEHKFFKYKSFVRFSMRIQNLSYLRNKSILAHGFEGISKDKIYQFFGNDSNQEIIGWIENKLQKFKDLFKKSQ